MAHMPVNHHLRPFYRVLAGAVGIALITFGVLALNRGAAAGLRSNEAGAVLVLVMGVAALVGAVIGRNVARGIHLVAGGGLLAAGMASMALLRTDANLLGFTMATCVFAFIVGLALLTAGLYEQVGSERRHRREEQFRHGEAPDPEEHILGADTVPRAKPGRR